MKEIAIKRRIFLQEDLPIMLKAFLKEYLILTGADEDQEQQLAVLKRSSLTTFQAYPYELLARTAASLGLETAGKSRLDLAKEIFARVESNQRS